MKLVHVENTGTIEYKYNTNCGNTINVGIKYVDEDQKEKLRKQCTDPMKGKKLNFKNRLYRRMLARAAIGYIKNMTFKDLNYITEPAVQVVLESGENWTDTVQVTDEIKEWLVTNMIEEFSDFIDEACSDVETFQKKASAKEMNNLKHGSAAPQEN